ncbi:MAG: DNA replication/repair protein RecF [bacterium]
MFFENLNILNFRNFVKAKASFSQKTNLIYGLNAQGKTNLLEAIYLLCLGRSFRTSSSQELIKNEASFFTIEGNIILDSGINKTVFLKCVNDRKKEIGIDHKRLKRHSEIFGKFPIVVMSPEDYKITLGGPLERRRFVDIFLSQVSVKYITHLQEYFRILKQRNKILQNIREGVPVNEAYLEPWTQSLVNFGSKIINERQKFINDFSTIISPIYRQVTESKDELEVSIESSITKNKNKPTEDNFLDALANVKNKERILGITLVGPHRDDMVFKINGLDIRKYGSRGEHKSVLITTKIAEFNFINQKKEETPIFLLDDYYSELDNLREEKIFNLLQGLGQTFLTSPKESVFNRTFQAPVNKKEEVSFFYVENGQIEQKST